MPYGCSVTLRSLSLVLQLRHPSFGQLLCPVLPLRSLSPSFRCITPAHSHPFAVRHDIARHNTQKPSHKRCTCLWQSLPCNTRRVPFRYTTSFTLFSSIQSTRCLCLARLLSLPRLRVCHGFCSQHKARRTTTKAHAKPLRDTLLPSAAGRGSVATSAAGTRSRLRSSPAALSAKPALLQCRYYRHGLASFSRRRYYLSAHAQNSQIQQAEEYELNERTKYLT